MTLYENVVAWLQTNLNQTIDNQEFYSQVDRFGIIGINGPAAKFTPAVFMELSRAAKDFGCEGKWEYMTPEGDDVIIVFTPDTAQAEAQAEMDLIMEKIGYPHLVKKYNLSIDPAKCSKMPHEHALIFVVAATVLDGRYNCFEQAVEMIPIAFPQVPESVIEGEKLSPEAGYEVMVEAYRRAFKPTH